MSFIDLELILMRQLASCLAMPVFIVNRNGDLVFYNEQAEKILGRRFEESGPMPINELAPLFHTYDENDNPIPSENLPLAIALTQKRPAHQRIWIRGLDGRKRFIEATAIPIIGQHRDISGAASFFWEIKDPKK